MKKMYAWHDACHHCRKLILPCDPNWSVVLPPTMHWLMSHWSGRGFFCLCIWGCTHNPCRLWGGDGGLFSSHSASSLLASWLVWESSCCESGSSLYKSTCRHSPPVGADPAWKILHQKQHLSGNPPGPDKEGWKHFPVSIPHRALFSSVIPG